MLPLSSLVWVPGSPACAPFSPGPPARTLEAPPSPSGPTVNWKGLPGTCSPLYLTLTLCTPISVGTKRTLYVSLPVATSSAGQVIPEGERTSDLMSCMSTAAKRVLFTSWTQLRKLYFNHLYCCFCKNVRVPWLMWKLVNCGSSTYSIQFFHTLKSIKLEPESVWQTLTALLAGDSSEQKPKEAKLTAEGKFLHSMYPLKKGQEGQEVVWESGDQKEPAGGSGRRSGGYDAGSGKVCVHGRAETGWTEESRSHDWEERGGWRHVKTCKKTEDVKKGQRQGFWKNTPDT